MCIITGGGMTIVKKGWCDVKSDLTHRQACADEKNIVMCITTNSGFNMFIYT